MMASSTGVHCPNVAFFVSRGVVSRKFLLHLKKQGHCNGVATAREINNSDLFIGRLVSRCQSVHKSRDVIGEELATLQISEDVLLCPESNHGGTLVDVTESFQHLPDTGREVVSLLATRRREWHHAMQPKAVLRVSVAGPSGSLPPHITYLLEIGFNLEQIKVMAQKHPYFAYHSLERNTRPLIEFLLDLGVSESDLPRIVVRYPQLFGLKLSKNVIPKMELLETLGVDKRKWAKLLYSFPALLTVSQEKVEATVEFLYEMGLSEESIGKLITRFPVIVGLSIKDQLRAKAEYFRSFGVDVAVVLRNKPQVVGLSMEDKLKPITEFFLENGFSIEEVGTMISKHVALYSYSLKANLVPKWEFFSTMDYPRQDLVKFPHYFSYSFEDRIKPRYNLMKESGVKLTLGDLLIPNNNDFKLLLKKRIERLLLEDLCNLSGTTNW